MAPYSAYCMVMCVVLVTGTMSLNWRLYSVTPTAYNEYGAWLNVTSTKTLLGCCGLCNQINTCTSVIHNNKTSVCKTNSGIVPVTSLPASDGWRYAEWIDSAPAFTNPASTTPALTTPAPIAPTLTAAATLSTPCTTGSDCSIVSSVCDTVTSLCKCDAGYSFHSATGQCVTACSSYGNTFQVDWGYAFMGGTSIDITPQTLEDCKTACINESTCRVAEFKPGSSGCQLYSQTALELTNVYGSYSGADLYQRDCAPGSTVLP